MSFRVGLFGGSFDPVHIGHQKIVKSFLESGQIDSLWILPSPNPPHKTDSKLSAYNFRCEMVEAAFKNWSKVRIVRIEETLPAPNYTLKTIQHLQKAYTGTKFVLCIGSDSLKQINTWYRYKELLSKCKLLVAIRPDFDISETPLNADLQVVKHQPVPFSSTEIREKIKKGEPVIDFVPDDVLKVITKYDLYKNCDR